MARIERKTPFHEFSQLFRVAVSMATIMLVLFLVFYVNSVIRADADRRGQQFLQYNNTLERIAERVDGQFTSFLQITSVIEKQDKFRPVLIHDGRVSALIRARDELKRMIILNPMLYEIGIYYKEDENLITSQGVYNSESLHTVFYKYGRLTPEEVVDLLRSTGSQQQARPYIHGMDTIKKPYMQQKEVVTLFYPIPYPNQSPYATLILQVDGQQLMTLLNDLSLGEMMIILDADDNQIISTSSASSPVIEHAVTTGAATANEAEVVVDGVRYYQLSAGTGNSTFRYLLYVPAALIDGALSFSRPLYGLFLAVSMLLILFLCVILIRWAYSPMKKIFYNVLHTEAGWFIDESKHIQGSIDLLAQQNSSMLSQITQIIDDIRESVIIKLSTGQYETQEEALSACERVGIRFSHDHFLVLCADMRAPFPFAQSAYKTEHAQLYIVGDVRAEMITGIVCSAHAQDECVRALIGQAFSAQEHTPVFSAGSWSIGVCDLRPSWRSATKGLESLRGQTGIAGGVYFADRIPAPETRAARRPVGAADKKEAAQDSDNAQFIEAVLTYIHENLETHDFSISSVSSHFSMKESTFSHMFKRHLNRSFTSHVNDLKIARAQNLLLNTDMSIEEIALKLGYSSSSNFGRMFKASVELTPHQYRLYAANLATWKRP